MHSFLSWMVPLPLCKIKKDNVSKIFRKLLICPHNCVFSLWAKIVNVILKKWQITTFITLLTASSLSALTCTSRMSPSLLSSLCLRRFFFRYRPGFLRLWLLLSSWCSRSLSFRLIPRFSSEITLRHKHCSFKDLGSGQRRNPFSLVFFLNQFLLCRYNYMHFKYQNEDITKWTSFGRKTSTF